MITMAEIARMTGVSQPTVSRALNGNPTVSPEIREKVLACAKEHDYQPNALALGMKGNKTKLLGVLMKDLSNGFFADLAKCIESEATRLGYSIILFNSDHRSERQQQCIDVLKRYKVDGLLAVPIWVDDPEWIDNVNRLKVPTVVLTVRSQNMDSVYLDHESAGQLVAKHLVQQGYTKFLFVGDPLGTKYLGFAEALQECGVKENKYECLPYTNEKNLRQKMQEIIAAGERAGIFTANDIFGAQVLRVLYEMNVSVPAHAGVVGFDDTLTARWLTPSLSSVRQPLEIMAQVAVQQLVNRIDGKAEDAYIDFAYEAELIERESSVVQK